MVHLVSASSWKPRGPAQCPTRSQSRALSPQRAQCLPQAMPSAWPTPTGPARAPPPGLPLTEPVALPVCQAWPVPSACRWLSPSVRPKPLPDGASGAGPRSSAETSTSARAHQYLLSRAAAQLRAGPRLPLTLPPEQLNPSPVRCLCPGTEKCLPCLRLRRAGARRGKRVPVQEGGEGRAEK